MATDLLRPLVTPRENLRVFAYVANGGGGKPQDAVTDLKVGINTWYAAVRQLEGLGLIAVERAPGGKKIRHVNLTASGVKFRAILDEVEALVADSPAALRLELEEDPPRPGSPRAGEALCLLIEDGERHMDWAAIRKVEEKARALKRPGEEHLARGVLAFFTGEAAKAEGETARAMEVLQGEGGSRSFRRALAFHAFSLELLGQGTAAFQENMRLRKLAREAGDAAMEVTANLTIGILKGRRGQFADSVKYFERGVAVARKSGLVAHEARLLCNLGFSRFFADVDGAIEANDLAIKAARACGARQTLAHAHLNRALYLAAKGQKTEGRAALKAASAEYRKGGEERGPVALQDFLKFVRRTLSPRRMYSLQDLRDQALQSTRLRPSRPPGAP